MLLMFEEGIREGVSMIIERQGKTNNPYMTEKYDPNLPTKYHAYLDANNFYGWSMCKHLPELGKWKNHPCILEIDLEYPQEFQDFHNDYPLGPERF